MITMFGETFKKFNQSFLSVCLETTIIRYLKHFVCLKKPESKYIQNYKTRIRTIRSFLCIEKGNKR